MDLSFREALDIAESPKESIALGLVLLSRIADALETLAEPDRGDI